MALVCGLLLEEFAAPSFEHSLGEDFVAVHAGNRFRPIRSLLIGRYPRQMGFRLLLFRSCRFRSGGGFVLVHPVIGFTFFTWRVELTQNPSQPSPLSERPCPLLSELVTPLAANLTEFQPVLLGRSELLPFKFDCAGFNGRDEGYEGHERSVSDCKGVGSNHHHDDVTGDFCTRWNERESSTWYKRSVRSTRGRELDWAVLGICSQGAEVYRL